MVENYKHLYIYVIADDLYVCMYVCMWGICRFVGMCTYCMRFFGILAAATAACCSYRSTFLLPTHIHVNIYTYIATYVHTFEYMKIMQGTATTTGCCRCEVK